MKENDWKRRTFLYSTFIDRSTSSCGGGASRNTEYRLIKLKLQRLKRGPA